MQVPVARVMPEVKDIERFVVTQIIENNSKYHYVAKILRPEMFFDTHFRLLYAEIQKRNGENITSISLADFAQKNNIPFICLISTDIMEGSSVNELDYFARIIFEYYARREAIIATVQINQLLNSRSDDVFLSIEKLKAKLDGIMAMLPIDAITTLSENVEKYDEKARELNEKGKKEFQKVKYGFDCMNDFCGGDDIGDLVLFAGERSQGKTSFAMSNMYYAAQKNNNYKGAIISLEMTEYQSTCRFISAETRIELKKIKAIELDSNEWNDYFSTIDNLKDKQIFFVYSDSDFSTIKGYVYELIRRHGVKHIVIDYINKIRTKQNYVRNDIKYGEIAAELQDIAKKEGVVIWLGMQLNKDRDKRVPDIDRLREGAQAADVADTIFFIYRPEVYDKKEKFSDLYDDKHYNIDPAGKAQIIRAKGRNSGTTAHILNFEKELTLFSEYQINADDFIFEDGTEADF